METTICYQFSMKVVLQIHFSQNVTSQEQHISDFQPVLFLQQVSILDAGFSFVSRMQYLHYHLLLSTILFLVGASGRIPQEYHVHQEPSSIKAQSQGVDKKVIIYEGSVILDQKNYYLANKLHTFNTYGQDGKDTRYILHQKNLLNMHSTELTNQSSI